METKNKMKKTLVTLLAITTLSLSGYSQIKPSLKSTGHLSIGYVPKRVYFRDYRNQLYKEVNAGVKLDFKKISFETSLTWANYSERKKLFFKPKNQKYTFDFIIRKDNFSLFFNHYCFHPVDMKIKGVSKDNVSYTLDYTELTNVGIKYEW